jgi:hypothetical protein
MSVQALFPAMDPLEASASRVLCGEGRYLPLTIDGGAFEMVFQPPSVDQGKPSHTLSFDFGGEISRLAIQFRPDSVLVRRIPGGLPAGPDALRKALLAVMCRELLDTLARSTNITLNLSSGESEEESLHALRFAIRSRENASGEPEAWGILHLGEKLTRALISAASAWPRQEGSLNRSLQLDCPVVIASLTIPSRELLSLRQGDMLLIGGSAGLRPEVRLPDGRRFKCPLPLEQGIINSPIPSESASS